MKKNKLCFILPIEAVIVSALYILLRNASFSRATLISFPFGYIGDLLRWLSFRGDVFNAIAIVIYALICVSPIIMLILTGKRAKAWPENIVLAVLSPVMFFGLYYIINPKPSMFRAESAVAVAGSVMAITIDSFILLYLVLRLVRTIKDSDKGTLYKCLKWLMAVTAVVIVAAICLKFLGEFVYVLPECEGGVAILGLTLKAVFDAASLILTLLIVLGVIKLVDTLSEDGEDLKPVTKKLCTLSYISLIVCTLSSAVLNSFNALFINSLKDVKANLYIPVSEIVFALIILLLTRLLIENKDLREDNELFI